MTLSDVTLRSVEIILAVARPAPTGHDDTPCADCGGERDLPGRWCSACLMVWDEAWRDRADYDG